MPKRITKMKKFLGTANYQARLTFYPSRKYYNTTMKVVIEIFEGRNSEGTFECNSISEVASKMLKFYKEKTGMDLELRRLARWFIEYLEEVNLPPPDLNTLLEDLASTPQEIAAREGSTAEDEI